MTVNLQVTQAKALIAHLHKTDALPEIQEKLKQCLSGFYGRELQVRNGNIWKDFVRMRKTMAIDGDIYMKLAETYYLSYSTVYAIVREFRQRFEPEKIRHRAMKRDWF